MLCENQAFFRSGMGLGKVKTLHQREVKISTTVTTRFQHLRGVSAYRGSVRRDSADVQVYVICHILSSEELSGAGVRAYSVRETAGAGRLFCFVCQSAIAVAVHVTRC